MLHNTSDAGVRVVEFGPYATKNDDDDDNANKRAATDADDGKE